MAKTIATYSDVINAGGYISATYTAKKCITRAGLSSFSNVSYSGPSSKTNNQLIATDEFDVYTYSLSVAPTSKSIYVGDTVDITATYKVYINGVLSSTENVTALSGCSWSSNSYATVNKGTVTGVSKGTAYVTASYAGLTATSTITVNDYYSYSLSASASSPSIYWYSGATGAKTATISATYYTYKNGSLESSQSVTPNLTISSGSSYISVSGTTVTGKATGTATIIASYNGCSSDPVEIAVNDYYSYSLYVSALHSSINVGSSTHCAAELYIYKNGDYDDYENVTSGCTWSSSNTSVATTSGNTVTGKSAGTARIWGEFYRYGSWHSDYIDITVNSVVTYSLSASISNPEIYWYAGTTTATVSAKLYTITDGVSDSGQSVSANVYYNGSIVSVSGTTVTGKATGTATLTVSYTKNGTAYTDTVSVTVNDYISYGLSASASAPSIYWYSGTKTATVSATYYTYKNGIVSSSQSVTPTLSVTSGSSYVSVSGTTVTGKATGTATIRASYNGYSDPVTINVIDYYSYSFSADASLLFIYWYSGTKTTTISGKYYTYKNGEQSYISVTPTLSVISGSSYVSVSGTTVTGTATGTATIRASYNGYTDDVSITVEDYISYGLSASASAPSIYWYAGIKTSKISAALITYTNGSQTDSESVTPNLTISSGSSYVSVSGTTVTGIATGTATITAYYNGYTDDVSITVNDYISYALTLIPSATSIYWYAGTKTSTISAKYQKKVNGNNSGTATTVTPTLTISSGSSYVSVSGTTVTGIATGTARITGRYGSASNSVTITVMDYITYGLVISPSSQTVLLSAGSCSFNAHFKTYTNGETTSSTSVGASSTTWSSTNTSVATHYASGTFRLLKVGNTTITAKYTPTGGSTTYNASAGLSVTS